MQLGTINALFFCMIFLTTFPCILLLIVRLLHGLTLLINIQIFKVLILTNFVKT